MLTMSNRGETAAKRALCSAGISNRLRTRMDCVTGAGLEWCFRVDHRLLRWNNKRNNSCRQAQPARN